MIERYAQNSNGTDYIVGDIHGHFSRMSRALARIGFNPEVDRLFSVGDLVDRGPESDQVAAWLDKPWFHAVRGNHEDYVSRYETVDRANWIRNGGSWFFGLPSAEQKSIANRIRDLPYAIEIETANGVVGIVHADFPGSHWAQLPEILVSRSGRDKCMWSRGRIQAGDDRGVLGVRAVVVGHTPLDEVEVLGNVIHIDTAGWHGVEGGRGKFTFLNATTLEAA
jgi:serine/threonine protein phosphatase 1